MTQKTTKYRIPKKRPTARDIAKLARHSFTEEWEPHQFHADPTTNAIYNVAAAIDKLAVATDGLLYGLKYSHKDGMSIAEAIEVAGKKVGEAIDSVSHEISDALASRST